MSCLESHKDLAIIDLGLLWFKFKTDSKTCKKEAGTAYFICHWDIT